MGRHVQLISTNDAFYREVVRRLATDNDFFWMVCWGLILSPEVKHIEFRDGIVLTESGDLYIPPKGVSDVNAIPNRETGEQVGDNQEEHGEDSQPSRLGEIGAHSGLDSGKP